MLLAATPSFEDKDDTFGVVYRMPRAYKLVYMSSVSKNSVDPDIDPSRIYLFVGEEFAVDAIERYRNQEIALCDLHRYLSQRSIVASSHWITYPLSNGEPIIQ
jgi:hypothetical protein